MGIQIQYCGKQQGRLSFYYSNCGDWDRAVCKDGNHTNAECSAQGAREKGL